MLWYLTYVDMQDLFLQNHFVATVSSIAMNYITDYINTCSRVIWYTAILSVGMVRCLSTVALFLTVLVDWTEPRNGVSYLSRIKCDWGGGEYWNGGKRGQCRDCIPGGWSGERSGDRICKYNITFLFSDTRPVLCVGPKQKCCHVDEIFIADCARLDANFSKMTFHLKSNLTHRNLVTPYGDRDINGSTLAHLMACCLSAFRR